MIQQGSGMTVIITVEEAGLRETRTLEVRRVTTESHKRLTAHAATRILRRVFPDFPKRLAAFKSNHKGTVFRHALAHAD
jgi:hypothetical protein